MRYAMSEALFNCLGQTPTGSASPHDAVADPRDWCRSVKAQAEPPRANLPGVLREDGAKPLSETGIWLLKNARVELDYLYNFIKPLGYVVLLADPAGTIIGHRGKRVESSRYRYWASWFNDAPDAVKHAEARMAAALFLRRTDNRRQR